MKHTHAVRAEHPPDQQPAVAVDRVFLGAHNRYPVGSGAQLEPFDPVEKEPLPRYTCIDHVALVVIKARICRTSSELLAHRYVPEA